MTTTRRKALFGANAVATGALLGQRQWGVFFMLQSYLASTALVYLLGTAVWLAGSLVGLCVPGAGFEAALLGAMLVAYSLFRWLAVRHAYDLSWLPVLLLLVACMGSYAGRFFRYRADAFSRAKWLFFLENCGFLSGMVLTVLGLFLAGAPTLVIGPWLMSIPVLATLALIRRLEPPPPIPPTTDLIESRP